MPNASKPNFLPSLERDGNSHQDKANESIIVAFISIEGYNFFNAGTSNRLPLCITIVKLLKYEN